jgi:hypothetical protein
MDLNCNKLLNILHHMNTRVAGFRLPFRFPLSLPFPFLHDVAGCLCYQFPFVPAQWAIDCSRGDEDGNSAAYRVGECAVAVPQDGKTKCGYLVVHENQRTKQGKTIRLPFAIMKSDSPTPLADPILYTGGGPGSSSIGMVNNRGYIPYLKNRDFIVFEQRGTRYAQPNLECPEVNEHALRQQKQT